MWADTRPSKGIVTAQCGAPHETRNLDIEVLRAFAIGGVILHHLSDTLLARQHGSLNWLMQHVDYWTGVDLFFAISGYVIARGTLAALWARNDWSGFVTEAGAFWIRRAFRLLPSSWFWLAMLLLASRFFNELRIGTVPVFGEPVTNIRATLAAVGFYANVFEAWAFSHGKFAGSFAWWSLSMEEQFYFVLPIVAFVLRKRLAIVLFFFALATIGLHFSPLGMMFRTEAIALGVLLALWEMHPSWARSGDFLHRMNGKMRFALICLLLLALGVVGTLGPFTYRVAYAALLSAALVFIAAQNNGYFLPPGFAGKVALWMGARSYGFYLIHVPAFLGAKELCFRLTGDLYESFVAPVGLIAMLIFVELNWRLLETPTRRYGAYLAPTFRNRRDHARQEFSYVPNHT